MTVTIVRELEEPWSGRACLVHREKDDAYFVISSISESQHFPAETLAFPAFADGSTESMLDIAGGRGASREEVIQVLDNEVER